MVDPVKDFIAAEADPSGYPVPLAVRPSGVARMLSLGKTKVYELLRDGELTSYSVGKSRFVLVASVRAYVERRVAAAAPSSGAG